MERKIGEIFNIDNEWYQVVKSNGECCKGCAFYEKGCKAKYADVGSCGTSREDWTQVIFKKLEKVGEPYASTCLSGGTIYFQRYRTYIEPIINNKIISFTTGGLNFIDIEIKQTKEDMEEKKLNLKPFDIQKAREGKPVCTRDGRKARIICFDQKDIAPIVGLVTGLDGKESIYAFYKDGRVSSQKERVDDLMMLPEKREGWVNVYNSLGVITFSHNPYDTKEEALEELKSASGRAYCVDTIKINWEE